MNHHQSSHFHPKQKKCLQSGNTTRVKYERPVKCSVLYDCFQPNFNKNRLSCFL